jgi:hypothetical protein
MAPTGVLGQALLRVLSVSSLLPAWSPFSTLFNTANIPAAVDPDVSSRLPVANPTISYWTHGPNGVHQHDANPLADYGSTGALTKDADVCIIGAGITGVSAAYHLSKMWPRDRMPLKTVVLEARDFCTFTRSRRVDDEANGLFLHAV